MSAQTRREWAALAALTATSLLLQVPFLGRGLSRLDEGSILAIADALNRGEVLYRDRATFIAPLVYEGMAALTALFGTSLLVGRVFQALVFSACTLLMYRVLREFAPLPWALAGALAFLAVKPLAFPLWTIPNYSQWATLEALVALLAGLRFLATRNPSWLVCAGLAVGLAGVTKQTAAGIIGVALATTITLDALLGRDDPLAGRLRALLTRGCVLLVAALPPVLFFASYYALRGAFGDALDRALLGLLGYSGALGVPLPDLAVWSTDPALLGQRSFVYFPTAVLALAWQGGLNLYSTGLALLVEHAVKLVYYGPVLATLAGVFALRGLATRSPAAALRILFVLLLAGLAYWSAAFRADWTHLMSVAPELILLCVVVLHHFARERRWLSGLAAGLCGAWLLGGAGVAAAALAAYATPLATARGELLVTPEEAKSSEAVLAHVAELPATDRIAFLPTQPLFYALTDRPILSRFDLLIPAYFREGDDFELARALEGVDEILYDPNAMPTIAASLADFAPESAALLARRFGFVKALSPTAYLFRELAEDTRAALDSPVVVDLFGLNVGASGARRVERIENTEWMVYRVIAATLRKRDPGACFSIAHSIGAGELLSFIPMLPPKSWGQPPSDDVLRRGRFSVLLNEAVGPTQTLFAQTLEAGAEVRPVLMPLDGFAGRDVLLRFCASRPVGDPPTAGVLGWAELQIHRRERGLGS